MNNHQGVAKQARELLNRERVKIKFDVDGIEVEEVKPLIRHPGKRQCNWCKKYYLIEETKKVKQYRVNWRGYSAGHFRICKECNERLQKV